MQNRNNIITTHIPGLEEALKGKCRSRRSTSFMDPNRHSSEMQWLCKCFPHGGKRLSSSFDLYV